MSAKKGSGAGEMVVGGETARRTPLRFRARPRVLLLAIGAALLVTGIVFAGYTIYRYYQGGSEKRAAQQVIKKQSVQQVKDSAGVKAFTGDTDGAVADLETKLGYTTNKTDRANIYNQIALIYAGKNEIEKAVAASEDATQEDPTYVRYATTALIYENAGNKPKAAEYYQKAVDTYNPNDKLNMSLYPRGVNPDIEQYKKKVKELTGA